MVELTEDIKREIGQVNFKRHDGETVLADSAFSLCSWCNISISFLDFMGMVLVKISRS